MDQGESPGWDADVGSAARLGGAGGGDRLRRGALHDDTASRGEGATLRLVDLADEFHLTTAQALEVCTRAGIPAAHGGQPLEPEVAARFRETAVQPVPTIEEAGAAARWAVPPPSASLEPPPPLAEPTPFVPLRIGDAAPSTPPAQLWSPSSDPARGPDPVHRRWRRRRPGSR